MSYDCACIENQILDNAIFLIYRVFHFLNMTYYSSKYCEVGAVIIPSFENSFVLLHPVQKRIFWDMRVRKDTVCSKV